MTTKQKRRIIKKLKERARRVGAGSLAIYFFIITVFTPSAPIMALTGGPSQPEFQSFEPVGTSDMVNPFSGDFTYNIPLLDVEGYPINLAYNSGITTDQEASWVGLGWNVNVGTINRALRGIPDDFKDEVIKTETNISDNWTVGLNAGANVEVFGFDVTAFEKLASFSNEGAGLGLNMSLGINYNNYTGVGVDLGLGVSQSFDMFKMPMNAGLGLNSSSTGGLNISPSLSLGAVIDNNSGDKAKIGASLGCSFNSRAGLSNLSIGPSLTVRDVQTVNTAKGDKSYVKSESSAVGASTNFNFQQPTYTPSIKNSMSSFAISGRVKFAVEAFGTDVGLSIGASYSNQGLKNADKEKEVRSYGYLYSEEGQFNDNAMHDFNREKEGSVTPATKNLALTNYTYDIYSVSGQGVGGSYRPYRGQIGHVYSNSASNSSSSVPITVELGTGALFHGGSEIGVTIVNSKSGPWRKKVDGFKGENYADNGFSFERKSTDADFENVFFREANEMSVIDQEYYNRFGGDNAVEIQLQKNAYFNVSAKNVLVDKDNISYTINDNFKKKRAKRNSTIQNLTIKQVREGFGIGDYITGSYAEASAKEHHIGQIISLGQDGKRYIYGQPAYNKKQQEVTFSVGEKLGGVSHGGTVNYSEGLVAYSPGVDNSLENVWGLDNYFQRVTTPAYAHSYLLTSVISDDYVDVDGTKGPSKGDLGTYTKFNYELVEGYKWRVPFQKNKASYNEGLKADPNDDKASYLYGEKEMFYLKEIETKNYIAVFELDDRDDAKGVDSDNGGIGTTTVSSKMLKKISLYTVKDYNNGLNPNATPIKEVHFVYDYELCQGVPNNINNEGKLTLQKVYFTYRDSKKGKLSPYEFDYGFNPNYNLKAYDRWGNYKENTSISGEFNETELATFEYPYVDQNQVTADENASAWTMDKIHLPSGGVIDVSLEADDYQFIQNKNAMEMAKIIKVGDNSNNATGTAFTAESISDATNKNRRIFFEKDPNIEGIKYTEGIDDLYFRCLMEFSKTDNTKYDYVSGYAKIDNSGGSIGSNVGWIDLVPVSFNDSENNEDYNPITLAAIQYGRLYLSNFVWDSPSMDASSGFGTQLLKSFWNSLSGFVTGFQNPNKSLWNKERGRKLVLNKSWLRLNDVDNKKIGGGCRVSEIKMNDSWLDMTAGLMDGSDYGQEYEYTLEDGTSSGVAAYEPQLGGDENPFKQPVRFQDKKRWAPDDRFYQETPFGESFFPSASVGYSRVTVRNLSHTDVTKNATGRVVHEYYTSKDFPTKVSKTELNPIRHKSNPFALLSIFNISSKDYYTGSQGFVVENNDMNGKPKGQKVYQQGQGDPISKVEYHYKQVKQNGVEIDQVANSVKVIQPNGDVENAVIGVNFDMVTDFNQSSTKIFSGSANINLDVIPAGFIPIPIPMIWPSLSNEKTLFRSAVVTKTVQKFGILESTVATDLGSRVETRNEAYDAQTGQVLLTKTITNYDDEVYSLNIPAYWHYDQMGQAYKNIGISEDVSIANGVFVSSIPHLFIPGDELQLSSGDKAWVTDVANSTITIQLADGTLPSYVGSTKATVIRSGRKNMQSQMMATIATLGSTGSTFMVNPLDQFKDNVFENVIQASAIEYDDTWRVFCDCNGTTTVNSTNPYVLGNKGNYKPIRSYLHLSERTQSDYNNNTNIRKDGVMESFTPFYQLSSSGNWEIDSDNWTFTSEITEFNPYGQELENKDALGRYSSAQFGFNQTLPKAVAGNSKYTDMGFTSFEDEGFSDCADNHFRFSNLNVVDNQSHSGRNSIRVTLGNSAVMEKDIEDCPDSCDLSILVRKDTKSGYLFVEPYYSAATSPAYVAQQNPVISFNIITGSPVVSISGTNQLNIIPVGPFQLEITIVDDNGCKVVLLISQQEGADPIWEYVYGGYPVNIGS